MLFGEGLHPGGRERARAASASADLLLVVGSSGQVGSARAVLRAARQAKLGRG